MKNTIKTRIICFVICIVMIFGMLPTVAFANTTDSVFTVDNGNSTYQLIPSESDDENTVIDLWKSTAAENGSDDSIVFNYSVTVDADNIVEKHNGEKENDFEKIGEDYDNAGEIEIEATISAASYVDDYTYDFYFRESATYGFWEKDLKNEARKNYLKWYSYDWTDIVTITPDNSDPSKLHISINITLKDLCAAGAEYIGVESFRPDELFVNITARGMTYSFGAYSTVKTKTTYIEDVSMDLFDAHSYSVCTDFMNALTYDYPIKIEHTPKWGGEGYYEPISVNYYWMYRFEKVMYDFETDEFWGDVEFDENVSEGVFTEKNHDGEEFGVAFGEFDAGSNNTLKIRQLLNEENKPFIDTFLGLKSTGEGGQVRLELNCCVTMTFADGEVVTHNCRTADEISYLVAPCIHSCKTCGLCTVTDKALPCNYNYMYGEATLVCACEEPETSEITVERVSESVATTNTDVSVTVIVEKVDMTTAEDTPFVEFVTKDIEVSGEIEIFNIDVYDEYDNPYMLNQWGDEGETLTVTIPVSEESAQAVSEGEATLYHINGDGSADEIQDIVAIVDGADSNLQFTNNSFSPFVLVKQKNESKTSFRVGREGLSKMPNSVALLYAYDKIAEGVENSLESIDIYDDVHPISESELLTVVTAYRDDYAEHFWIGNTWSYSMYSKDEIISFKPTYLITGAELEIARAEFDAVVEEILEGVTDSMSDYEKELYFHDEVAKRVVYNEATHAHNAYGALVGGVAVCEGYAEAFQVLLHKVGIRAYLVEGSSINPSTGQPEGHEWNAVEIDGNFYYVDVTWDDQGEYLFHSYFNIPESVLTRDHEINVVAYERPECTSTEMFYFNVEGGIIDNLNVSDVSAIFNGGYYGEMYLNSNVDFYAWFSENDYNIVKEIGIANNVTSYRYVNLGSEYKIVFTPLNPVTPTPTATPTATLTPTPTPTPTPVPTPTVIYGDVNGDTFVNKKDDLAMRKYLADPAYEIDLEAANVFYDSAVNKKDLLRLKQHLADPDVVLGPENN